MKLHDQWENLPAAHRTRFLNTRIAATDQWPAHELPGWQQPWQPLRPLILTEDAASALGHLAARMIHLAVDACLRRARTAGDLYDLLRYPRELPLLDRDRPLDHAELTACARPDILLSEGTPRFLELNISTAVAATRAVDVLAAAYHDLWDGPHLIPPPSVIEARSAHLAATLPHPDDGPPRLLIPTWTAGGRLPGLDGEAALRAYLRPSADSATRAGLRVIQASLSELRTDHTAVLYAGTDRVDAMLCPFLSDEVSDDNGGLAATARAQRAGTVRLFQSDATSLLSAKAVLAWIHQDIDLLDPADRQLVRDHLPFTLHLPRHHSAAERRAPLAHAAQARERLVLKPSCGHGGHGVVFGRDLSPTQWLRILHEELEHDDVVLQELVDADTLRMPFFSPGQDRVHHEDVAFVLSPYLIGGRSTGLLVRHDAPTRTTNGAAGSTLNPINMANSAFCNTAMLLRPPHAAPTATP
ncbi:hypothetical protein [Streptomyces sp. NPDC021096]|uniref:hypothetical protein n=1 Tax=Streptomyces sp. NPDC021096 TaxID=3154792 RepID=UPI0033EA11D1